MPINLSLGPYFDQLEEGTEFQNTLTVTETHIVLACGLFGDFNPVHMNAVYAEGSQFGRPVAPGPLTLGIMASALGNYFAGSAIANTGISANFKGPVHAGDTITTTWRIQRLDAKAKMAGGIVHLSGRCVKSDDIPVAKAEATVAVRSRPEAKDKEEDVQGGTLQSGR